MRERSTARWLLALLIGPTFVACAPRDDGFILLRRHDPRVDGEPTRLAYAQPDDATGAQVRALLADGFGAELLRTYAMAQRFAGRDAAPAFVALGASDLFENAPYRERRFDAGWFHETLPDATPLIWIDDQSPTPTLAQLTEQLGSAIAHLVSAPGCFSSDGFLRAGYALFLRTVAAEWEPGGSADQRPDLRRLPLFAKVRADAAALPPRGARPTPAIHLVRDEVMVATILYQLAASDLARQMAPEEIYGRFLRATPPRGLHPALLLGAFRNFQAKLFVAWRRASSAGHRPADVVDLLEAYGEAFPAERVEATRIFLVTTYGATVLGAPDPYAELATLTADVLFGKRGLRDGLRRPARAMSRSREQ